VDAKEKLRRYLEQRRELGETELVLDNLTVEDALRILGAQGAGREREARSPVAERPRAHDAGSEATPEDESSSRSQLGDWRAMLRAAGAAPESPNSPKSPPADDDMPRSNKPERTDAPVDTPTGLSVGTAAGELFGGFCASLNSLDEIAKVVASCTRCSLHSTATNPVPGEGNPDADFMCVGEAPGATEDETGRPFVGQAGQLLTKILAAINLKREDVYICNVLKHRPPGNRNPRPEEVEACSPYLIRQIELIRPKVILALGTFAAQTLLDTKLSIGKLRGQVHRYYGVPLVVTYHPAALLRNPGWKRPTWEDVQLARRILDRATPGA
jgi:DNA polymerase